MLGFGNTEHSQEKAHKETGKKGPLTGYYPKAISSGRTNHYPTWIFQSNFHHCSNWIIAEERYESNRIWESTHGDLKNELASPDPWMSGCQSAGRPTWAKGMWQEGFLFIFTRAHITLVRESTSTFSVHGCLSPWGFDSLLWMLLEYSKWLWKSQ